MAMQDATRSFCAPPPAPTWFRRHYGRSFAEQSLKDATDYTDSSNLADDAFELERASPEIYVIGIFTYICVIRVIRGFLKDSSWSDPWWNY